MKKTIFYILAFVISIFLIEAIGEIALKISDFSKIRKGIINNNIKHFEKLKGQAYLNFVNENLLQVNEHRYRGDLVSIERNKKKRILFLGGSTTFGYGVENYKDTYPNQLQKILGKNIEIINGGVLWGTSAEILTHYLFKYQYYNPDIIVINTGINDVGAYFTDNYQPDYNHWRGVLDDFPQHSKIVNYVMKSRFLSYIIIKLFYEDYIKGKTIVHTGNKTVQSWLPKMDSISLKNNAFYQNIKSLISVAKSKKTGIILYSNYGNPFDNTEKNYYYKFYKLNEGVLKMISNEENIPFLKFPIEKLNNKKYWIDECHLTIEGNFIKAKITSSIIKKMLITDLKVNINKAEFKIPLEKSKNKGWYEVLIGY